MGRIAAILRVGLLILATSALVVVDAAGAAPVEDAIAAYKRGDYESALQLFRPLAEQGDAKAQGTLGLMYVQGNGITQDYAEAAKWFRRSAEQGTAFAQFDLHWRYVPLWRRRSRDRLGGNEMVPQGR